MNVRRASGAGLAAWHAGTAPVPGCAPPDRWAMFGPEVAAGGAGVGAAPLRLRGAEGPPGDVPSGGPVFPAGVPVELTVEQAALLALENNLDLRVQRFNPSITATFEEIERGAYDPELFARGAYFEEEAVEVSRATEENFGVSRKDTAESAGLRQALPSGTDVELSVSAARSTSDRTPEQQMVRAGLTVTQALLRGFGPAVNLARVRQAELETVASLYELQGFTAALLAETESVYWRFALAAQRIAIVEESLQIALRQQTEVEQRIEIGVLAQTEAASARAEVAQRQQNLIDARSSMEILRLRLLRLVNPRAGSDLTLPVVAASETATDALPIDDLEDRIELASRERADLNEARLRLEQRRIETVVTRNGVLPRLDLFIVLGKTGYADSFAEAVRDMDGPTYDLTAGLEFSYPLGNRIAESGHESALLSRRQAAEAVANLEQLVRLDVRLAAAEAERARQQISATSATRALREEALRAENERFRVGESTSLLVAQAQRDLLGSRIDEVDAIVAYRLALIALYLAEGTLLSRRGLTVEAADQ